MMRSCARALCTTSATSEGVLFLSSQTVHVQLTNEVQSPALSALEVRGAGFCLPRHSLYSRLAASAEPTGAAAAEAVETYFTSGARAPSRVVFGGAEGDPLLRPDALADAVRAVRAKRHGVPFAVETNGLVGEAGAARLVELHRELEHAPGSDGSKLTAWVSLAAHQPPAYGKCALRPDAAKGAGAAKQFGEVLAFITALVEGGVPVVCTAVERPGCNVKATRKLATQLGSADFATRSWHPATLYDELGIAADSDSDMIANAYRAKALELHPDRAAAEDRDAATDAMARVAKAAELLGDPETRALYDAGVADLDGKDSGFESGAQKERVGGKSA